MSGAGGSPRGIVPEYVWRRERARDLCDAIRRYLDDPARKPQPRWGEELAGHLHFLVHKEDPTRGWGPGALEIGPRCDAAPVGSITIDGYSLPIKDFKIEWCHAEPAP